MNPQSVTFKDDQSDFFFFTATTGACNNRLLLKPVGRNAKSTSSAEKRKDVGVISQSCDTHKHWEIVYFLSKLLFSIE